MEHFKAETIKNTKKSADFYEMELKPSKNIKEPEPGQFLHIKCSKNEWPLLRRPISIYDYNPKEKTIKILYKAIGKGTKLLSEYFPGNELDILGPLGKGFPINEKDRKIVIIGGGIGIAPLNYLAKKLLESGKKVSLINGFCDEISVVPVSDEKLSVNRNLPSQKEEQTKKQKEEQIEKCETIITTEDGSMGFEGFPTQYLENNLSQLNPDTIYSCGPEGLLKEIKRISRTYNIPAYISLEEKMGCGIGACLSCASKTYKRVCKDGPVFSVEEVEL